MASSALRTGALTSGKAVEPLPDGYRIAPSRGYYYPQRQVGDVWLYFPANGLLLTPEIAKAKWCRTYENAAKYLNRYAMSEQKAWESGLFDGIPTLKAYDYSDNFHAIPRMAFVKIYPTGRGHFAIGSPDGNPLFPGDSLTVLLAGHRVTGIIQTSSQGDYLQLPDGSCCGLCACMRVVATVPEPEAEVAR